MEPLEKLPPDIGERIEAARAMLQSERPLLFAYLFGSLAAGKAGPLSDVDIAVYLDDATDIGKYRLELIERLVDVLGTERLDLVVLNTAPTSLAGRVLAERKVLVDREPFAKHRYESRTLCMFFEQSYLSD